MCKVQHPSEFMIEEMAARHWSRWHLVHAMAGDPGRDGLVVDLYFDIGPSTPNMRLGETAERFAHAFGVSTEFFINLEKAWLSSLDDLPSIEPSGQDR